MAFRADISVDWRASPRVVEVAAPSLELFLPDLYETLMTLEAQRANIDEPHIINASGLEQLAPGVQVSMTVTLLNAVLKFEDRPGPGDVEAVVTGGNLRAVDNNDDEFSPIANDMQNVHVDRVSSTDATIITVEGGVIAQQIIDDVLAGLGPALEDTKKNTRKWNIITEKSC